MSHTAPDTRNQVTCHPQGTCIFCTVQVSLQTLLKEATSKTYYKKWQEKKKPTPTSFGVTHIIVQHLKYLKLYHSRRRQLQT